MERKTPLQWKELFSSKEFEEKYFYDKDDLGAVYKKDSTIFKVWAPTAKGVNINFYLTGSDKEDKAKCLGSFSMEKEDKGIFKYIAKGDMKNIYYTFSVDVEGDIKETADIYAKASGVNGQRSMIVDLLETNPKGWENDKRPIIQNKDKVIYEIHIKDFSSDENSGITPEYQGKYLAFTEKNSTLNNDGKNPTCLKYLKQLGITYVHLLPCFDYGSVDESISSKEQFNWGYDPINYNVPEGSYSTNPFDGNVRIKEFKQMVQSLHEEGIGVIMDVVYNHTYSLNSWFQYTVPYYYYRIDENGRLANGSMCGNDTASERKMFQNYIINSVCYWVNEYHIDGFRFDLMGLHDIDTMNKIREALDKLPNGKDILMYGEPWTAGFSPMENNAVPAVKANVNLLDENIAIFCDNTRDSIKGSVFKSKIAGYVNRNENIKQSKNMKQLTNEIKHSVKAWCDKGANFYPKSPKQIISYVSSHDNYTLWDKLVYTTKNEDFKNPEIFIKRDENIVQINKMVSGIIFTCQGIPFIQAGEEAARTKQGLDNSYNTSSTINQLDWKRAYEFKDLFDYYKKIIQIRKDFSPFGNLDLNTANSITFLPLQKKYLIAFIIEGGNKDDKWSKILVYYNPKNSKQKIELPQGEWNLILGNSEDWEKGYLQEKSVTIFGI